MTSIVLHERYMIEVVSRRANMIGTFCVLLLATMLKVNASPEEDAKTVAVLDTKYQAAVKANDAATMDQILADALLWIKSLQGNTPADYKLWFSDTYVRTPTGWRYVFGQASLAGPHETILPDWQM